MQNLESVDKTRAKVAQYFRFANKCVKNSQNSQTGHTGQTSALQNKFVKNSQNSQNS